MVGGGEVAGRPCLLAGRDQGLGPGRQGLADLGGQLEAEEPVEGRDGGQAGGRGQRLPAGAEELIAEREQARAARDFAAADRLRDRLAALGVEVTDTRAGTSWRLQP